MNREKALVKLAQVRLAINYVLRTRDVKQASVNQNPSIPVWEENPYISGDEFYTDDGKRRYYYRSAEDMDRHIKNPFIKTRPGTARDMVPISERGPFSNMNEEFGTSMAEHILQEWNSRRPPFQIKTPELGISTKFPPLWKIPTPVEEISPEAPPLLERDITPSIKYPTIKAVIPRQ